MSNFYTYISTLNMSTWMIIVSLVAVAGYIMQQIVESRMLTALFMLAFQIGALFINFMSYEFEVIPLPEPEVNLIALSTVGMVIALLVSLLLMRVINAIADASRQKVERRPGSR